MKVWLSWCASTELSIKKFGSCHTLIKKLLKKNSAPCLGPFTPGLESPFLPRRWKLMKEESPLSISSRSLFITDRKMLLKAYKYVFELSALTDCGVPLLKLNLLCNLRPFICSSTFWPAILATSDSCSNSRSVWVRHSKIYSSWMAYLWDVDCFSSVKQLLKTWQKFWIMKPIGSCSYCLNKNN